MNRLGSLDEIGVVHAVTRERAPGVMVDVGAHYGSSLRPFAKDGWRVFAFEPDPANRQKLEHLWGGADNVIIDPRAISEQDGAVVQLFVSDVSSGISSMAPFHPSHQGGPSVETVRLDTYLAAVPEVTVLKTDTEGWDLPVLRTFPWDRLRPAAVVCEFEDHKTIPRGYSFDVLAQFMHELGYSVLVSEWYPVVEYGQQHRWRSLRPYPTRLSDPRAWGNLICVDPTLKDDVVSGSRFLPRLVRLGRRASNKLLGRKA